MSTTSKTWVFLSGTESWVASPASGDVIMQHASGDGSPASGSLESRLTGKNKNPGTSYWKLSGTWASLFGISVDDDVTQIESNNVSGPYKWICSEYTTGTGDNISGPLEIWNAAETVLIATLAAAETLVTDTTSWAFSNDNGAQSIDATYQAATTSIVIRLASLHRTGNSASAAITFRQDTVDLKITYTTAGVTENLVAAITGSGLATAELNIDTQLVAATTGSGLTTAELNIDTQLVAAVTGSGLTTGVLNITKNLVLAITGTVLITVDITKTTTATWFVTRSKKPVALQFRWDDFQLSSEHILSDNLRFALFGKHPGGETAFDSSPFKHNGTLANMDPATDWRQRQGRQTLNFDGDNNVVTVGHTPELSVSKLTLVAWAHFRTLTQAGLIIDKDASYFLWHNTGHDLYAGFYDGLWRTVVAVDILNTGEWCHIGMTYDGEEILLYLNGNVVGDTIYSGTIAASSDPVTIGHRTGLGTVFAVDGELSDLCIFGRALSTPEIKTFASSDLTYDCLIQPKQRKQYYVFGGMGVVENFLVDVVGTAVVIADLSKKNKFTVAVNISVLIVANIIRETVFNATLVNSILVSANLSVPIPITILLETYYLLVQPRSVFER